MASHEKPLEPGGDPWRLQRFVEAQAPLYETVCAELAAGAKRSHWMWFVFPQLKGLGRSQTAQHFGLAGADEARAYWEHPVLGRRLAHCADLISRTESRDALEIFGSPDDLKLKSCLTLFAEVVPEAPIFEALLVWFFGGERDANTLALLDSRPD